MFKSLRSVMLTSVGCLFAFALFAHAQEGATAEPSTAQMTVHADQPGAHINREIFTQFAEHLGHGIYEGIWVGADSKIPNRRGYRTDVIEALKALSVPVVRWPGGCFADEYHWRDGIGQRSKRPVKVNTHWGGVTAKLAGLGGAGVSGHILTAPAINAINTFDQPDTVVPQPFAGARIDGDTLHVTLPPKSVVMLDLQ